MRLWRRGQRGKISEWETRFYLMGSDKGWMDGWRYTTFDTFVLLFGSCPHKWRDGWNGDVLLGSLDEIGIC